MGDRQRKVPAVVAVVTWGAALIAGALGGCGPGQPAKDPDGKTTATAKPADPPPKGSSSATASSKPFDQCDNSPPLAIKYLGLLKDARCDFDRYPIMAGIATQLGVKCNYCHVPDPNDAKNELYPVMTQKKEIANWMSMHLMKAIKPADGSQIKCSMCHADEAGKPTPKILKSPRDTTYAHEWMSLVMTTKFVVAATGEKLKCKHCHVGNYGTPEWQAKVILTDHIPPH
jgi:hypothetical protein